MSAYVYNVYEYCNTVYMQLILAILVCKKQQLALIYTYSILKRKILADFVVYSTVQYSCTVYDLYNINASLIVEVDEWILVTKRHYKSSVKYTRRKISKNF